MAAPLPPEPDAATLAARLALLRQYVQTSDAAERAALLARLVATVPPGERPAARARLLAWVATADAAPDAAATEPLLQALAGAADPGEAADPAIPAAGASTAPEDQEIQAALDAATAAWAQGAAPPAAFPAFDLTFLRANDLWAAGLTWALEVAAAAGRAQIRIPFTAAARAPAERAGRAIAGAPVGAIRDLLVVALGPAPQHGLPDRYQLAVQAARVTPTTCRLLVNVRGRGLRARHAEIRVTLARRVGSPLEATANPQGTATFEALPISDLDGLTVTINLPTTPPADTAPA
jgi:hypothetical protein